MNPQPDSSQDLQRHTQELLAEAAAVAESPRAAEAKLVVDDFCASFGRTACLRHISLTIRPRERLAIIGPASGGKTTLMRSLNRLNDLSPSFSHSGAILLAGPGTGKVEFKHYLSEHAPKIDARISAVETLDHPTDGELLALARKFFKVDDRMHAQGD